MGYYSTVGATLDKFFWNLRLLPTFIEIDLMSSKIARDRIKAEEKKKKPATKKERNDIFKVAKEKVSADRDEKFSDTVDANLTEIIKNSKGDFSDAVHEAQLIKKGSYTNDLINYALFYMTDESANLLKLEEVECELVNAIAEIFNFGKIYQHAGVTNIRKYDYSYKDDFISNGKFFLSIADIEKRKSDPAFMEKLEKKKELIHTVNGESQEEEKTTSKGNSWKVDEDGIVHPIFVNPDAVPLTDEMKPQKQGMGISDDLFSYLEKGFSGLINEEYRYEAFGDLVKLYISRSKLGIEEEYIVDPGLVMGGNKICVLANVTKPDGAHDTIFVPTDKTLIIKNVLLSAFYILTDKEYQEVLDLYFRNMNLYRYIDMSNTEFINKMDKASFQKLGKKLTYILSQVANQSQGMELPRFRFNQWKGVEDFIIISDPDVKSPMALMGITSPQIVEGLIFEVKGDKITQYYKGTQVEYEIEKYGDM